MPYIRLAILLLLAALPVWAQRSAEPSADVPSPRQHGPRKTFGHAPEPDTSDGSVKVLESTNWGGYAVTGLNFTQAQGSWTVPTVDCTKTPNTYASFWVGIDGWNNGTVEQLGTDSDCNGTKPSFYAWYEFYPKYGINFDKFPVSPGDQISASVNYDGEKFTLTITNQTTNLSASRSGKVPQAKRASAEWIAEAPCCQYDGNFLPLSDFGTISFGEDSTYAIDTNYASNDSASGPIGAFGGHVRESVMVTNSGAKKAVPSSLSSDGTSFTVTWYAE